MEITRRPLPDGLELAVEGRLDAYWADVLTAALDEVIREGVVLLSLDLTAVRYLSSGGIRALIVAHRELGRVGGALRIERLSDAVRDVLEMAGLLDLLVLRPQEPASMGAPGQSIELAGCTLEVWSRDAAATLDCRVVGDPDRLDGGFGATDCQEIAFPTDGFGLGIGAFGAGFDDCRSRFGELLTVAGAQACQPTDGNNVPDFTVTKGTTNPPTWLVYGVSCAGALPIHARFQALDGPIDVSALATAALELAAADTVAMVVVGETTGLVGAALRRSPALADAPPELSFPSIRRWLSFTSDRAWPGSQALIVGIAARAGGAAAPLDRFLRPAGRQGLRAHFHAAAFSYRPLPRGPLDLAATAGGLFETEALRGLLHLLHDDREAGGLGETELRRGAVWLGPLATATHG